MIELRHWQENNNEIVAAICGGLCGRFVAASLLHFWIPPRSGQVQSQQGPSLIITQFNASGRLVVGTQSPTGSLVVVTQLNITPPSAKAMPRLVAPGFESNVLFQLREQRRAPGVVEGGFLYDGLRPQDFPRINRPGGPLRPQFNVIPEELKQ